MTRHYFDEDPSVPSAPREVRVELDGEPFRLTTDAGVFAHGRLDPGTAVLLATAPAPRAGPLLDLGCGYGPLAVALARARPDDDVWAVDVNRRARELTAANAAACRCPNVRTAAPDDVPTDATFATIWSNPPIRIGKVALDHLLGRWLGRLRPDGECVLVVSRHLGADSLARRLSDLGWAVDRVASRRGYRVLRVTRPTKRP